MLSIGPMSGGQGRYYQELAREDYYLNGGEPLGRWWGAKQALGLPEIVSRDSLHNLFLGRGPDGKDLVQNAGSILRRPGFDFTFNAPKSVSIQAFIGGDARLVAAYEAAVTEALRELETFACH